MFFSYFYINNLPVEPAILKSILMNYLLTTSSYILLKKVVFVLFQGQ